MRQTQTLFESAPLRFPFTVASTGSLTIQLQILLDRAGFSPGTIDGGWGINAAKAMTFFAKPDDSERLNGDSPPPVKSIDEETYNRLRSAARATGLLRRYTLTALDLKKPFTQIPSSTRPRFATCTLPSVRPFASRRTKLPEALRYYGLC